MLNPQRSQTNHVTYAPKALDCTDPSHFEKAPHCVNKVQVHLIFHGLKGLDN